jgi:nucleotide-binding universal stress UspA family protein
VVNTIVFGVDGSLDGRHAVEWACALAQRVGARVVAVHAVGMLEHQVGDPGGDHLRPQVAEWTAALDQLPPDRVERRLVAGDPVGAVVQVVAECRADLVVVGTRGAGARHSERLGSTSLHLAEGCPCPLVIVPRAE